MFTTIVAHIGRAEQGKMDYVLPHTTFCLIRQQDFANVTVTARKRPFRNDLSPGNDSHLKTSAYD